MAGELIRFDQLATRKWQLLRTELALWDDPDDFGGCDGFSRFWCQDAVFDVYWVAEKSGGGDYQLHLSSDLTLNGFRDSLPFTASFEDKQKLAEIVGWQSVANRVLVQLSTKQMPLFEE